PHRKRHRARCSALSWLTCAIRRQRQCGEPGSPIAAIRLRKRLSPRRPLTAKYVDCRSASSMDSCDAASATRNGKWPRVPTPGAQVKRKQRLRAELGDQRVGQLEIGVDVLNVVVLVQVVDQLEQLLAGVVINRDGVLGPPC